MKGTEWEPGWKAKLTQCGLDSWETLWSASGEPVDEPNTSAHGRSWVTRLRLELGSGPSVLYLKRQVNWTARRGFQAMIKRPRAHFEWASLQRCRADGLPVPEPVCFAARRMDRELRSLIVTAEIPNAYPLDIWFGARSAAKNFDHGLCLPPSDWWAAIEQAGATLRRFHRAGIRHGSLYPKHLFLSEPMGTPAVLMDLERMRWLPLFRRRHLRDLESLHRRTPQASRTERLRFLLGWQGCDSVNEESRKLWSMVQQRAALKRKR